MTATVRTALALAFLLAVFALKGLLLVPPAPSPSAEFDTERAIGRLERILGDQRPHPVDSAANDAVRARLIDELRGLGLSPVVRERPDCRALPESPVVSCSLTRNVVAVIGADRPGKALLLNAHYDSTPAGPGAADDGIGVAVLLEIAADLRSKPPAQPVILLFNEGEEYGLNGAGAFVGGDPLARHVGSLINLEARGVDGPAFMFETSELNGPAIDAFAAATRRPYANSLTADFAKLIPNYTDVVVFKDRGWKTLSYAIVGNETRYHSPGDRVEALDRRSLYHMGSEALAATRTLPGANGSGQRVYADIAGRLFLSLPLALAALLLAGLFLGSAWIGWRKRALGRPLLACAVAVTAGIAVAFALAYAAGLIRAGDYWRAYPLVSYMAVYAALLAAMLGALRGLGGRTDRDSLRAACWLLTVALGGLLSLLVPGSMIFFLVAPALALAAWAWPKGRTPLLWAAALIQLLMFAQLLASIELLLIDGPLWAVAPLAALAALPFLVEIARSPMRWPLIGLTALALLLWAAALLAPRSSAERPLAFTIDYIRDDDGREAHWAVASKQAPLPAEWSTFGKWKRGELPYSGRTRWLAQAPPLVIPAGSVTVLGEKRSPSGRTVRLRFDRGGADTVALRFAKGVTVRAMGLAERPWPIEGAEGQAVLRCSGRSCDGMVADVELEGTKPVEAAVIATRFELPPEGARLQAARPHNAHSQYGTDSSVRVSPIEL